MIALTIFLVSLLSTTAAGTAVGVLRQIGKPILCADLGTPATKTACSRPARSWAVLEARLARDRPSWRPREAANNTCSRALARARDLVPKDQCQRAQAQHQQTYEQLGPRSNGAPYHRLAEKASCVPNGSRSSPSAYAAIHDGEETLLQVSISVLSEGTCNLFLGFFATNSFSKIWEVSFKSGPDFPPLGKCVEWIKNHVRIYLARRAVCKPTYDQIEYPTSICSHSRRWHGYSAPSSTIPRRRDPRARLRGRISCSP